MSLRMCRSCRRSRGTQGSAAFARGIFVRMPVPDYVRAIWRNPQPGRLLGPGHPAGDFLDGPDWRVLEATAGRLVVDMPIAAPEDLSLATLRRVRARIHRPHRAAYGERRHG